jgi:SAM-dependent methyltransferase
MKLAHFSRFLEQRYALAVQATEGDEVVEGYLTDLGNPARSFPIVRKIPRFVAGETNYCDSFGLQWNRFRRTQFDSHSHLFISRDRLWRNTGWQPAELNGKTVLEVGSGAGRFTEVLLQTGATVVSCDYSTAVDANLESNWAKGDLFIFQGDLYDLPLSDGTFDFVFCYGVIQHTPKPEEAYRAIFAKVKPGGRISIDVYRRFARPRFWPDNKYTWRRITTRLPPRLLFELVRCYVPLWLPFDTALRRIRGRLGYWLRFLIPVPCWNYTGVYMLTPAQLREWAVMDTFDALAAKYDQPQTLEETTRMIQSDQNQHAEVCYGSNGIVARVKKKGAAS